jgi:beta-lactamase regulating signal transducer with metallopeptidase domain
VERLLHVGLSNAIAAVVLAVVLAGVAAVCRRPALVHSLWALVLLKLVTPPIISVPVPWPAPAPAPTLTTIPPPASIPVPLEEPPSAGDAIPEPPDLGTIPFGEIAGLPPVGEPLQVLAPELAPDAPPARGDGWPGPPVAWPAILLTLWLAGSIGWLTLAVVRIARFRRLLRFAQRGPSELQHECQQLAKRLGLTRCPEVWLVPGAVSPMLWALGAGPRLLLPSDLLKRLDHAQRSTLLAHELAHLRRRDHWLRGLELLATALYWWHPVVWWARRELREAEEQCCDAWVVWALPGAARAYATALLETMDFLSEARPALPAGASGIGHVRLLKRRLTMIMRGTTPRALTCGGWLAVLGLAALLLPLMPGWAQERPRPAIGEPPAQPDREGILYRSGQLSPTDLKRVLADHDIKTVINLRDATPEEQKARAEVAQAFAEVKQLQAQLQAAEVRLKVAQFNLIRILNQGKDPNSATGARQGAAPVPAGAQAHSDELAQARTDLLMLKAQLEIKQALLLEGKVRLEASALRLARAKELIQKGIEPKSALENAQAEVKIGEAQLQARAAEVTQAEAQLALAEAKLARLGLSSKEKEIRVQPKGGTARVQPEDGTAPAPSDTERRLFELEKKMDALLRAMDKLQAERKQPPAQ